jgi:hypothetical protein
MAKEQKPKAGWLDRRRQAKRERMDKKVRQIADQRREQAAGAERATRGWRPGGT